MPMPITEKTIYKQKCGNIFSIIFILFLLVIMFTFCSVFCGIELGWTNLLTIIFLISLGLCLGFTLFFFIKMLHVRSNLTLYCHGSAAALAARINDGLKHPRYLSHLIGGNNEPFTLITNDFIVSFADYLSLTDIRDIRKMKATYIPQTVMHAIGVNAITTAAALAVNAVIDRYEGRYLENQGINENTILDYLVIVDDAGKTKQFGVHHQDMEEVLNLLLSLNPQIQLDPNPSKLKPFGHA